jgi:hypothetical protein
MDMGTPLSGHGIPRHYSIPQFHITIVTGLFEDVLQWTISPIVYCSLPYPKLFKQTLHFCLVTLQVIQLVICIPHSGPGQYSHSAGSKGHTTKCGGLSRLGCVRRVFCGCSREEKTPQCTWEQEGYFGAAWDKSEGHCIEH